MQGVSDAALAEARKSKPHSLTGKVSCQVCGRAFDGYSSLAQHLVIKHGGRNTVEVKIAAFKKLSETATQPEKSSRSGMRTPLTFGDLLRGSPATSNRTKGKKQLYSNTLRLVARSKPVAIKQTQPVVKTKLPRARIDSRLSCPVSKKKRLSRLKRMVLRERLDKHIKAAELSYNAARESLLTLTVECQKLVVKTHDTSASPDATSWHGASVADVAATQAAGKLLGAQRILSSCAANYLEKLQQRASLLKQPVPPVLVELLSQHRDLPNLPVEHDCSVEPGKIGVVAGDSQLLQTQQLALKWALPDALHSQCRREYSDSPAGRRRSIDSDRSDQSAGHNLGVCDPLSTADKPERLQEFPETAVAAPAREIEPAACSSPSAIRAVAESRLPTLWVKASEEARIAPVDCGSACDTTTRREPASDAGAGRENIAVTPASLNLKDKVAQPTSAKAMVANLVLPVQDACDESSDDDSEEGTDGLLGWTDVLSSWASHLPANAAPTPPPTSSLWNPPGSATCSPPSDSSSSFNVSEQPPSISADTTDNSQVMVSDEPATLSKEREIAEQDAPVISQALERPLPAPPALLSQVRNSTSPVRSVPAGTQLEGLLEQFNALQLMNSSHATASSTDESSSDVLTNDVLSNWMLQARQANLPFPQHTAPAGMNDSIIDQQTSMFGEQLGVQRNPAVVSNRQQVEQAGQRNVTVQPPVAPGGFQAVHQPVIPDSVGLGQVQYGQPHEHLQMVMPALGGNQRRGQGHTMGLPSPEASSRIHAPSNLQMLQSNNPSLTLQQLVDKVALAMQSPSMQQQPELLPTNQVHGYTLNPSDVLDDTYGVPDVQRSQGYREVILQQHMQLQQQTPLEQLQQQQFQQQHFQQQQLQQQQQQQLQQQQIQQQLQQQLQQHRMGQQLQQMQQMQQRQQQLQQQPQAGPGHLLFPSSSFQMQTSALPTHMQAGHLHPLPQMGAQIRQHQQLPQWEVVGGTGMQTFPGVPPSWQVQGAQVQGPRMLVPMQGTINTDQMLMRQHVQPGYPQVVRGTRPGVSSAIDPPGLQYNNLTVNMVSQQSHPLHQRPSPYDLGSMLALKQVSAASLPSSAISSMQLEGFAGSLAPPPGVSPPGMGRLFGGRQGMDGISGLSASALQHSCGICGIVCNSSSSLEQHMNSKKHLQRAAKAAMAAVNAAAKEVERAGAGIAGVKPLTYIGPNAQVHSLCRQVISVELNAVVAELLQRVKGYQERAVARNPLKAAMHRWYVCGLREVKKVVKLKNAKCVILAPNIEQIEMAGGLNDHLNTILSKCEELNIPAVFALSRKKMGEIYGFRKRVSAVALLEVNAVMDLYQRMQELAEEGRLAWRDSRGSGSGSGQLAGGDGEESGFLESMLLGTQSTHGGHRSGGDGGTSVGGFGRSMFAEEDYNDDNCGEYDDDDDEVENDGDLGESDFGGGGNPGKGLEGGSGSSSFSGPYQYHGQSYSGGVASRGEVIESSLYGSFGEARGWGGGQLPHGGSMLPAEQLAREGSLGNMEAHALYGIAGDGAKSASYSSLIRNQSLNANAVEYFPS